MVSCTNDFFSILIGGWFLVPMMHFVVYKTSHCLLAVNCCSLFLRYISPNTMKFFKSLIGIAGRSPSVTSTGPPANTPSPICELGESRYYEIAGLIADEHSPQIFTRRLDHCRFEIDDIWVRKAIDLSIEKHQASLFRFFIDRITFDPQQRDDYLSSYMVEALGYDDMAVFEYLWYQDHHITFKSDILKRLSNHNFGIIKQLLASYPKRAIEIAPQPEDIENSYRPDLLIDLALVCSGLPEPVQWNPSNLLVALVQNRHIGDEDMVTLIGRLWDAGAIVDGEVYAGLQRVNPNHRQSLVALRDFEQRQHHVKEPGRD